MTARDAKIKMKNIMEWNLKFGQVIAAFVVVLPATVGAVTYLNTTFQTKVEAAIERERLEKRIDAVEITAEAQGKLQANIFGEVKSITGYLQAQSEQKK